MVGPDEMTVNDFIKNLTQIDYDENFARKRTEEGIMKDLIKI